MSDGSKGKDTSGYFSSFVTLCDSIEKEDSYTGKTQITANFLKKFNGDLYLLCKFLLCKEDKRVYNIKDKSLVKLLSRYWDCPQTELVSDLENGDASETAKKYLVKYGKPAKNSTLTLKHVDEWLEKLTNVTKEDDQLAVLGEVIPLCTPEDLRMLWRIVDHDLRIKTGPKFVLGALHPDAFEAYNKSNDLKMVIDRVINHTISKAAKALNKNDDEKAGLNRTTSFSTAVAIMTPIRPMLARPCKSIDEVKERCPNGAYAEIKYDGERIQIHKENETFKCFSRHLKAVMPHKLEAVKEFIPKSTSAKTIILDAEILLMDTKRRRPLPFGTLGVHKKAAFKEATVCLFVFDILYLNGKPLLDMPIKERRVLLEKHVNIIPNRVELSELTIASSKKKADDDGEEPLKLLMAKCLKEGLEGLVVKDANSVYEPSARHWLKIKKDYLSGLADSADLICLGAYFGSGNYGGMLSVFLMGVYDKNEKKFLTVCKVGNGFDEKTIHKFQGDLKNKMEKIGGDFNKVPSWLRIARNHVPDYIAKNPKDMPVWEVVGAEFTDSPTHTAGGISIRFPRVIKERHDKSWKEATDLDYLKDLVKSSVRSAPGEDVNEDELAPPPTRPDKPEKRTRDDDEDNNGGGSGADDGGESSDAAPKKKQKVLTVTTTSTTTTTTTTTKKKGKGKELNYIVGDVREPQGDLGNKIVVVCSDDTGRWGNVGIFKAISDKWPKVQEEFENKKPKLGTCLLVKVPNPGDDNKLYVAVVVGQKVQTLVKTSAYHHKSFDQAVGELAALAKHKSCSVHFARLSPSIPELDWTKVEKSLIKHLTSKNITTYIYSLTPMTPQPAPPKQGKKKEKKKDDVKADSDDEDDAPPPKTPPTKTAPPQTPPPKPTFELPSVFRGVTAYVHPSTPNYAQLTRYIIAYNGNTDSLGDDVTHVIVRPEDIDSEIKEHQSENPSVHVVNPLWAWDSINTCNLRSEDDYVSIDK